MLKPFAGLVLALAADFATATPVTATVVDFNGIKANQFVGAYSEDGYTVIGLDTGTSKKNDADPTGQTLSSVLLAFGSSTGDAFDLQSFDLANAKDSAKGGSVLFTYTVAGETPVSEWLSLNKTAGLQTQLFSGLDDLTSFSLIGNFQIDNIAVTPYVAPSAVPEPDSLALVLAGLGIVATVARRRTA